MGGALLVVPLGVSSEPVDRLVAGGGGDPRAGLVGDPGPRPLLEGHHEGVLHRVLGAVEVAEDAGEGGEGAGASARNAASAATWVSPRC